MSGPGSDTLPLPEARWITVDDRVMGGRSRSAMARTDAGHLRFAGVMSVVGGGFASVRTAPADLDLAGFDGLQLHVRGDGKRYRLRLRMDDELDGVAWQLPFDTRAGEWITLQLPFADFRPSFRGRPVPGAGPVDPARVRQLGVMLADGQDGAFALEIGPVRRWRAPKEP